LTGVAAYTSTKTANGTSNLDIPAINGNVTVGVNGNANIVVITDTGANVNGYLTVNGNLLPNANGTFSLGSPTARWKNVYITGNTIDIDGATIEANGTALVFTNPTGGKFIVDGSTSDYAGVAKTVSQNAQPNITSVGTLTSLAVTGNISSGNANLGNLASANYFSGNGYYLSNVTAVTAVTTTQTANGTSNVTVPVADGNVNTSVNGNANVLVVTGTGINVAGTINATGNMTASYVIGNGSQLTAVDAATAKKLVNGTSNVDIHTPSGHVTISAQGVPNVALFGDTYANIAVPVTITGNLTASNAGLGNLVTANYFSGSGNLLSNIQGGNVSGQVGNALVAGTVYTNAQPNITSLGSLTGLTVSNATGVVNFTTTANVTLGSVSNLHISGGSTGQYLKTDGSGGLSWASVTTGTGNANVGGSNTQIQYNNGTNLAGSANLTFNNTTNTLTTTNLVVNGTTNLGAVSNVTITGGTANQILKTDGSGSLSWTTPNNLTVVVDNFTGNGVQTDFTLSTTPADETFTIVAMGGLFQPRTTYTVSGSTISFSSAPANTAPIEVTTFSGTGAGASTGITTGKAIAMAMIFGG
jgi:hypothetical protein